MYSVFGNPFVSSQAFAQAIMGTSNYYVLITRESLYQLPYSVDAVLELRKTTSRHKCTYNRTYPYYGQLPNTISKLQSVDTILTEDSNSGHQMFAHIAQEHGKGCMSAGGKSNIHRCLEELKSQKTLVVADGAAFGAEMERYINISSCMRTRQHCIFRNPLSGSFSNQVLLRLMIWKKFWRIPQISPT